MKTVVSEFSRQEWKDGQRTLEIGYPWLSFGAIIALEQNLKPTDKILETGSGGSTLFFARRTSFVRSYERDAEWLKITEKALEREGVRDKVSFALGDRNELWAEMLKEPDEYYDWILADMGSYFLRACFLIGSIPKLKTGGWMVIDNYTAYYMAKHVDYSKFRIVRTFDDLEQAKLGTRICMK